MTTNSFGTAMPHLGYTQPKCAPFRCPKVAGRMQAATSVITAAGAGLGKLSFLVFLLRHIEHLTNSSFFAG